MPTASLLSIARCKRRILPLWPRTRRLRRRRFKTKKQQALESTKLVSRLFPAGCSRLSLSSRREFIEAAFVAAAATTLRPAWGAASQIYPFEEVPSSKSGISWVHRSGMSPERYLPETMGAGCAFLDYDNDGWMDIYLVNSGKCDFFDPSPRLSNALYKNNRDGTFTDVTEKAGVGGAGYGQGVAVGDYDGD